MIILRGVLKTHRLQQPIDSDNIIFRMTCKTL